MRVVSPLQMSPGKHKGQAVGVSFSFPLTFKLDPKVIGEAVSTNPDASIDVPFAIIDEVPIFPDVKVQRIPVPVLMKSYRSI